MTLDRTLLDGSTARSLVDAATGGRPLRTRVGLDGDALMTEIRPGEAGQPSGGAYDAKVYVPAVKLAIFSDVHANLPGLEAVLADIDRADVDRRYVLGDLVGYAPWPNEVLERLRAERIPIVMGNYDDGTGYDRDECGCAYIDPTEKALGDESFSWTKARTSDENKAFLRGLAPEIRFDSDGLRFLLVHGSPRRMNEYLFEDKPDSTLARIAAGANADVIVCGHTHRPYDKTVGATRFVNAGSAGKPKDGDPRACWVLIEAGARTASVEFRRVAYDVETAARAIEASDLPSEFAVQLREARGYQRQPVAAA
jgi:putative phosphoesterase